MSLLPGVFVSAAQSPPSSVGVNLSGTFGISNLFFSWTNPSYSVYYYSNTTNSTTGGVLLGSNTTGNLSLSPTHSPVMSNWYWSVVFASNVYGSSLGISSPIVQYNSLNVRNISGVQVWLDSADASAKDISGTEIRSLYDKTGLGRNMNVKTAAPGGGVSEWPVVGTAINGKESILFTAGAGLSQSNVYTSTKEVYWVGRQGTPTGNERGQFLFGHPSAIYWHAQSQTTPTHFLGGPTASGILNATSTMYTNGSNTTGSFSSALLATYGDVFFLKLVGITGSTDFDGICYDRSGTHSGWCGDLGEIITFSSNTTADEKIEIEGYLATKWGLTSCLPNGHKYKP